MKIHWKMLLPVIVAVGLQAGCSDGTDQTPEIVAPVTDTAIEEDLGQQQWYVGGTLHEASALDWQQASAEDKLATVADLLARAWKNDLLAPDVGSQISEIDDFRPFAEALAAELDDAFSPAESEEENRRLFVNQEVATTAVVLMVMQGWME